MTTDATLTTLLVLAVFLTASTVWGKLAVVPALVVMGVLI